MNYTTPLPLVKNQILKDTIHHETPLSNFLLCLPLLIFTKLNHMICSLHPSLIAFENVCWYGIYDLPNIFPLFLVIALYIITFTLNENPFGSIILTPKI